MISRDLKGRSRERNFEEWIRDEDGVNSRRVETRIEKVAGDRRSDHGRSRKVAKSR
jgi:hypothetical protein